MDSKSELFPAFIRIEGADVTVFGGGSIAFRKVTKLLKSGGKVRVISPDLAPPMMDLYEDKCIDWEARRYRGGDVGNAQLVVAATNDSSVNEEIWREATSLGRLVNVVDNPNHCTFMFPAVVDFGTIHLAISTSGTSPKGAKDLRRALEHDLQTGDSTFAPLLRRLGDSDPK